MTTHRSGYAAILGRPNVGKSTLLNQLLGQKLSITSPKPQTTRWQILGIKSTPLAQIIYVDTPGLNKPGKLGMTRYLNRVANSIILDADVIVFMMEALGWREQDELVLNQLKAAHCPIILAINKIDALNNKADILPLIEKLKEKINFSAIIPMSALEGENISALEDCVSAHLPEGPAFYPEDQTTDKTINFQISEIIREKIILATEAELPYTTAVQIERFKDDEKVIEIGAIIWVERPGQKIIIIGKKGERLKRIGTKARLEIEKRLKSKVFLRLWVKRKTDWTDDERALKNLGYD